MRNALIVIGVLAALLVAAAIGLHFSGLRLQRAQVAVEKQTDNAVARELEVTGTRELTAAADRLATATNNLRTGNHEQDLQTARDPAATDALPASVRARVAADDGRLCASGLVCGDER